MLGKDKGSLKELFGSRLQTGRQKNIMIMADRAGLEVIVHVYKGIEVYGDSRIVRVFFSSREETRHENARSAWLWWRRYQGTKRNTALTAKGLCLNGKKQDTR